MFAVNGFDLERMEKAFRTGIVVAVTFSTHTTDKLMFFQQFTISVRTILASPIRMHNDIYRAFALDCAMRKAAHTSSVVMRSAIDQPMTRREYR